MPSSRETRGTRMLSRLAGGLALLAGLAGFAASAAETEARSYRTEVAPAGAPERAVSLYAEEAGAGSPVLLIHGLGESTFTWRHIVPRLAQRHRVIALDLKGFGRSDKPREEAYTADDQGALVAAFIEKRDLRDLTLIGHSFGGTVALRTALVPAMRASGRIARLAVISAPALPGSVAADLELVVTPLVPEVLTASLPPETFARLMLSEARGGRGEVPEEDVKGYAAPYHDFAAKQAFLVTARAIVSERGEHIGESYRTIRQPVLAVWCRDDTVVPLRAGRRLVRTLPNARLAVLKGCHHLPQDERPGALIAQLKAFLGH